MKFLPHRDRVLVRIEAEEYRGRLILPNSFAHKPYRGEVIAKGKEAKEVNKGDVILFNRYGGIDITIGGDPYTVLKEKEIFVIVQ